MREQNFTSELLNIAMEANLEFMLCGYFQFLDDRDNFPYKFGLVVSTIANGVLLIGFLRIIVADKETLIEDTTEKRWGALYLDINIK